MESVSTSEIQQDLPAKASFDTARNGMYTLASVAVDVSLLALGLLAAVATRLLVGKILSLDAFEITTEAVIHYLSCLAVFALVLIYEGVYTSGLASLAQTDHIVKALSGGLAGAIFYSFVIHDHDLSRIVLTMWYVLCLLTFTLARPILRGMFSSLLVGKLTIIVESECTASLIRRLKNTRIIVDPSVTESRSPASIHNGQSTVFITRTNGTGVQVDCLPQLEGAFGNIGIIPTDLNYSILGANPINVHGLQIYSIEHPLSHRSNRILKRTIDIVGVALLALPCLPILLLSILALKLDSPGPAFFGHQRMGRDGKPFKVWKLRTMVVDAEARLKALLQADPNAREEFANTFKLKNDPRVTPLGRFLRKTSLDELPQLWNVLVGEMSLVGPRPIVAGERVLYGEFYQIVSTVQPGITGVWQTSGRNLTSYEARKHFDTHYVRNWSIWLDLAIIVRTLQAVILPDDF